MFLYVLAPITLLQWNYDPTKMIPAPCVAPVVAPKLLRGDWGTLRERAVAVNLPLDRQGQRKSVYVDKQNPYHSCCYGHNWRVSFDNEFLHITPNNRTGGIRETRPVSKACQRVTSGIDSKVFVRSAHPRCITKREVGLAPS